MDSLALLVSGHGLRACGPALSMRQRQSRLCRRARRPLLRRGTDALSLAPLRVPTSTAAKARDQSRRRLIGAAATQLAGNLYLPRQIRGRYGLKPGCHELTARPSDTCIPSSSLVVYLEATPWFTRDVHAAQPFEVRQHNRSRCTRHRGRTQSSDAESRSCSTASLAAPTLPCRCCDGSPYIMDHAGEHGQAAGPGIRDWLAAAVHRRQSEHGWRAGEALGSRVRSLGAMLAPLRFHACHMPPVKTAQSLWHLRYTKHSLPSPNPASILSDAVARRMPRWKRTTLPLRQRRGRTLACGRSAGAPALCRTCKSC